eukprot:NODE_7196_length_468_cov_60.742243_g6376_i0.p4 GENE.NODE_7196_length_468_cov_60.742243_g6376_i0~~NODE_7196_length_468_cov_60.742243_g6376_i0.p4  ORF type:complete len:60 (-),score=6.76 NODE_7196_length_468_cov_60.742243_g6376_i0:87-266(-)
MFTDGSEVHLEANLDARTMTVRVLTCASKCSSSECTVANIPTNIAFAASLSNNTQFTIL